MKYQFEESKPMPLLICLFVCLSLIYSRFLTYDPIKRITAEDALKHTYFKEAPMIVSPSMLPTWPAKSEGGHAVRKAQSPRPPSGGRAYKQLGENDDVETGFHMGNTNADRHIAAMGAGFSLKFWWANNLFYFFPYFLKNNSYVPFFSFLLFFFPVFFFLNENLCYYNMVRFVQIRSI